MYFKMGQDISISKQYDRNTQTIFPLHTGTDYIKTRSLYCILTSFHTAGAVLNGPSGGQCLPMTHQP